MIPQMNCVLIFKFATVYAANAPCLWEKMSPLKNTFSIWSSIIGIIFITLTSFFLSKNAPYSLWHLCVQINFKFNMTWFLNPFWKFPSLILSTKSLVRQYHNSIISFPAQNSAQALRSMPHSIKCQEIVFADLELIPE